MSYTAVINSLKILLPLVALGLLSTLFLFARTVPEEATLPYIDDLRARVDGSDGMRSSFFTGSTDAGDAITVQAAQVRPNPEDPDLTNARELWANIAYQDGSSVRIAALDAEFSDRNATLEMSGDVVITSSTGYEMRTNALIAETETGAAHSPGPVEADGPPGQIRAGRMSIQRDTTSGGTQLVFTEGVKLVYTPAATNE